jgi:hypothetical protein
VVGGLAIGVVATSRLEGLVAVEARQLLLIRHRNRARLHERPAKVSVQERLLAQGLGIRLDEIREHRDVASADRRYRFDAGEIPAGTIASVRMRFDGISMLGRVRVFSAGCARRRCRRLEIA